MPLTAKAKHIKDFISGVEVKATPEEIEAVQVFSRRLVEEYGYAKSQIQTRPQFRVRESPSGKEKYPVDIAVFKDDKKTYSNLFMVVECKRKTRRDGLKQLQMYMGLSSAQVGVWFNGSDHAYIQKNLGKDGSVTYLSLPEIPKKGQSILDIGKHMRRDLQAPHNLKSVFKDIRNHLAGMAVGISRDEVLAREIINILFCKIRDELHTGLDNMVTVRAGVGESAADVKKRIQDLFEKEVKREYNDVFDGSDTIQLDDDSVLHVVSSLQNYCITDASRDAIGEAFEVFIGPALRGGEGQFFTPRNAVKMIVDIIDPQTNELVLDPACGSGGFLIGALEQIWAKTDVEGQKNGWSSETTSFQKKERATKLLYGIDKDAFLSKVTKAYMALMGDGRGGVFCGNSLKPPKRWDTSMQGKIRPGSFDIVITNPPFGKDIDVSGEEILSQYELAKKWKLNSQSKKLQMTSTLVKQRPPQIIFVERCIQMLKDGGRLGIILPESLFGNPSHEYVIEYLRCHGKIIGLVSLPDELFQPYTHAKTCVLFFKKTGKPKQANRIFMSIVKHCGHDSRGNPIPYDDIPQVRQQYIKTKAGNAKHDSIGFMKKVSELRSNILIPKYYDPHLAKELACLKKTHNLLTVGSLVESGKLSVARGVEVGKLSYNTGSIPFIRTSDLTNWEIKIEPKQCVSEEIYSKYSAKCDLQENDILLVKDGTYLIGTCALVTKNDVKSLFQSHILRMRSLDTKTLPPFLLLAALSSPIVKKQIRSKQFSQDIIETLGSRINELILPIPKEQRHAKMINTQTKSVIDKRMRLREQASAIPRKIQTLDL